VPQQDAGTVRYSAGSEERDPERTGLVLLPGAVPHPSMTGFTGLRKQDYGQRQPKSDVSISVRRVIPIASSAAGIPLIVRPAAPAQHGNGRCQSDPCLQFSAFFYAVKG
jgi:hypothetical protein